MNEFLPLHCCWSRIFFTTVCPYQCQPVTDQGSECFFSDTITSVFIVTPSSCITSLVCMFFFTSRVSASFSKFSFFTSFLILRSSSNMHVMCVYVMCVCIMCVCMYVCMYVCICVWMGVCMCVCMCVYACVCMHVCVCMYACMGV